MASMLSTLTFKLGRDRSSVLRRLQAEQDKKWRAEFLKASKNSECMTLLQFMECTSCRSRYFAVKLFDSLDTNGDGVISYSEYARLMQLFARGYAEDVATFMFNLLDDDRDGEITQAELWRALQASIQESEATISPEEATEHFNVLFRHFTEEKTDVITRDRFVSVLKEYPDVVGNFTVGDRAKAASLEEQVALLQGPPNRLAKTRRWIENHPQRAFTYTATLMIIVICLAWRFLMFADDCDEVDLDFRDPDLDVTRQEVKDRIEEVYGVHMSDADARHMVFSDAMAEADPMGCRNARKRELLSWTLPVGKAFGQALKPVLTLILFPVSRTLMTNLRGTSLRNVFDFDNAISYHRFLGKVGFWLSWGHSLAQFWHVHRWQDKDNFKQWSYAFPQGKGAAAAFDLASINNETPQYRGIPLELLNDPADQPSAGELIFMTWAGATGVVLILIYTVAALFAFDYPKGLKFFKLGPGEKDTLLSWHRRLAVRTGTMLNNFNFFWYSHNLFAIFYVALILHPLPDLPDERKEWGISDTWIWVAIPAFIYLTERTLRSLHSSRNTPVVGLRVLPGRVVELKVKKPEGVKYKSGQYIFINIRQIARFEWHPFTLTSAPHEAYLSMHIRSAGDWTGALYKKVSDYKNYSNSQTEIAIAIDRRAYPFNVRVAGPYGAPAQNYQDYPVFVCIGAGIGVTPFASILNTVLNTSLENGTNKVEKVYFHWAVRTRKEATWFKTLVDEIAARDTEGILSINIHITALKEGNDLRVMLLRLAEFEAEDTGPANAVCKSVMRFGRPDWTKILRSVKRNHDKQPKIGVFYCGPQSLKSAIKVECVRMNRDTGPKFYFRKEIF